MSRQAEIRARNAKVAATPLVRKLADKHGVDLTQVVASGAAGRITRDDVVAAGAWRETVDWARKTGRIAASRVSDYVAMGEQDPRATVDLLRSLPAAGSPRAAEPTWFGDGPMTVESLTAPPHQVSPASPSTVAPLPPVTASGIDPKVLLQVSPVVRQAVAEAESTQSAYALLTRYQGMSDEDAADMIGRDSSVSAAAAFAWRPVGWTEPGTEEWHEAHTPDWVDPNGVGPTALEMQRAEATAWQVRHTARYQEQVDAEAAWQRESDTRVAAAAASLRRRD